jgi:hypothetical protein
MNTIQLESSNEHNSTEINNTIQLKPTQFNWNQHNSIEINTIQLKST